MFDGKLPPPCLPSHVWAMICRFFKEKNKKKPAKHTSLIVTRHKLVCSPMACPAALIPCRGINSVRTWSRSLLTLCIQATSTANHLAKEIGRGPETSKISWETNDVAAEWSISQLSQPFERWVAVAIGVFRDGSTAPSDSEAHKTKTSFQRPRRPHLTMASEGKPASPMILCLLWPE